MKKLLISSCNTCPLRNTESKISADGIIRYQFRCSYNAGKLIDPQILLPDWCPLPDEKDGN